MTDSADKKRLYVALDKVRSDIRDVRSRNEKMQQQQVAKPPMLKRVLCNYLPVSNVDRASKWYADTFGLTIKKREPGGAIIVLGDGQWFFLLEATNHRNANFMTNQWDGENYEMFSLTFEVGNIVELHKKLRETG